MHHCSTSDQPNCRDSSCKASGFNYHTICCMWCHAVQKHLIWTINATNLCYSLGPIKTKPLNFKSAEFVHPFTCCLCSFSLSSSSLFFWSSLSYKHKHDASVSLTLPCAHLWRFNSLLLFNLPSSLLCYPLPLLGLLLIQLPPLLLQFLLLLICSPGLLSSTHFFIPLK